MSTAAPHGLIQQVLVSDLRPGPWQPRRVFEEDALAELAMSIKMQGVLTPLRIICASGESGYLIVAGERRWRAATLAGLRELPCLEMDRAAVDSTIREIAILDNLH